MLETFMMSEVKVHIFWEAPQFWEIFTLLSSSVVPVKSKVKIWQNFVAFSEYMKGQLISKSKFSFVPKYEWFFLYFCPSL